MKKVGILTMHYSLNEGSMLQAYFLQKLVKKIFIDWDVEIIDFRHKRKNDFYNRNQDNRKIALNSFVKKMKLSKKSFLTNKDKDAFNYIEKNYNAIIVGSDEVWKLKYSRFFKMQKDPLFPPFPNIYWPDTDLKSYFFAFATSVGDSDVKSFPLRHRLVMSSALERFTYLGFRDKKTANFIQSLDNNLCEKSFFVPDPTFGTDVLSVVDIKNLKVKLSSLGVNFSKPLLLVISNNFVGQEQLINNFKKQGYQSISLSIENKLVDVDLSKVFLDPLEWAAIFMFADFCIIERFHGCVYSIIFSKPFMAVDFREKKLGDETKIKDLLERFNLENFRYTPHAKQSKPLLEHLNNKLEKKDFKKIQNQKNEFKNILEDYALRIKKYVNTN
jgi:polysaccharide pyruvyl transferase WcaK-like protein